MTILSGARNHGRFLRRHKSSLSSDERGLGQEPSGAARYSDDHAGRAVRTMGMS